MRAKDCGVTIFRRLNRIIDEFVLLSCLSLYRSTVESRESESEVAVIYCWERRASLVVRVVVTPGQRWGRVGQTRSRVGGRSMSDFNVGEKVEVDVNYFRWILRILT